MNEISFIYLWTKHSRKPLILTLPCHSFANLNSYMHAYMRAEAAFNSKVTLHAWNAPLNVQVDQIPLITFTLVSCVNSLKKNIRRHTLMTSAIWLAGNGRKKSLYWAVFIELDDLRTTLALLKHESFMVHQFQTSVIKTGLEWRSNNPNTRSKSTFCDLALLSAMTSPGRISTGKI